MSLFFFFFNDTPSTEIYTLSLHDALPILQDAVGAAQAALKEGILPGGGTTLARLEVGFKEALDRKSTRLNSSHANISYAVFCLKKKKNTKYIHMQSTTRY